MTQWWIVRLVRQWAIGLSHLRHITVLSIIDVSRDHGVIIALLGRNYEHWSDMVLTSIEADCRRTQKPLAMAVQNFRKSLHGMRGQSWRTYWTFRDRHHICVPFSNRKLALCGLRYKLLLSAEPNRRRPANSLPGVLDYLTYCAVSLKRGTYLFILAITWRNVDQF